MKTLEIKVTDTIQISDGLRPKKGFNRAISSFPIYISNIVKPVFVNVNYFAMPPTSLLKLRLNLATF